MIVVDTNVLATLVLSEAMALMQRAEVLLAGREQPVASEQPLRACDCEFMAAAQQLGVPLVTEDRAVLAAFPEVAMPLDSRVA